MTTGVLDDAGGPDRLLDGFLQGGLCEVVPPDDPVRGSAARRVAGKRYCQPSWRSACGYFSASACGICTRP
jgi:hypothetical protein